MKRTEDRFEKGKQKSIQQIHQNRVCSKMIKLIRDVNFSSLHFDWKHHGFRWQLTNWFLLLHAYVIFAHISTHFNCSTAKLFSEKSPISTRITPRNWKYIYIYRYRYIFCLFKKTNKPKQSSKKFTFLLQTVIQRTIFFF